MSVPAYDSYRDSGVERFGELPAHWKLVALKRVATFAYGDALASDVRGEGKIKVFGSNGPVGTHSVPNTTAPVVFIGRKGSCGALNWSDEAGFAIDTVYFVDASCCRSDLRWFYWVLHTLGLESASQDTGVPGLGREVAHTSPVPLPSPAEQAAIAAFLDRETGKIDALVEAQTRLIELLKEKRQAVISHAVTKGLDPAAPMKDSGVEWLGQVPAHWEVGKLGYFSKLQGGYAFSSELFGSDGVSVVRMNNLNRGRLDLEEAAKIPEEESLDRVALVPGDLLWGMSGSIGETGSLGNFARVADHDVPCQLNQRVGRFLTNARKLRVDFLELIIQSQQFNEQVLNFVTGTAQFNISSEQVQSCAVALPSVEEQTKIVTETSGKMTRLNGLIEAATDATALLQERRSALISAAVTGKIDVRGLAPEQAEAA